MRAFSMRPFTFAVTQGKYDRINKNTDVLFYQTKVSLSALWLYVSLIWKVGIENKLYFHSFGGREFAALTGPLLNLFVFSILHLQWSDSPPTMSQSVFREKRCTSIDVIQSASNDTLVLSTGLPLYTLLLKMPYDMPSSHVRSLLTWR